MKREKDVAVNAIMSTRYMMLSECYPNLTDNEFPVNQHKLDRSFIISPPEYFHIFLMPLQWSGMSAEWNELLQ